MCAQGADRGDADKGNNDGMLLEAELYELQAGGIGSDMAGHFYPILMMGYLTKGNLPHARFTYKRIPADVQGANKNVQASRRACGGET